MNEKIIRKLLVLFASISFLFILAFTFFLVGLSKVEAKSYSFSNTPAIRITSGQSANDGTLIRCNNTYHCWYSENGDYVGNFAQYQYGVINSNNSTDSYYEKDTYILTFRSRIVALDSLSKSNLQFRLYYYPNSSSAYSRAYCDSGETFTITYNNSDRDVYVDYTCNEFEITSNVTYFVISIGNLPNTIFGTQVSQNLKLIGSEDATNKDLINSIDNSTSSIIENNNSNTDKIVDSINNQNKTNEEIKDYITDTSDPSSDISSLGNVSGLLPPGPLDSLLNIPFKFLSIVVSSLGDVCVPLSGNFVFDSQLVLPCFSDSFYDNVPSALMIFINLIPTTFLLIKYFKYLYKKVERATTLNTTTDDEWGCI